MARAIIILFLLAPLLRVIEPARILAWFPTPSISHQIVFRPLTQELARRGHELILVTPDPAFSKGKSPENLQEIDVHDISYATWNDFFFKRQDDMNYDVASQMELILRAMEASIDVQLDIMEMKTILKGNEKFDLLLFEGSSVAALAVSYVVKAPVVLINSFGAISGQFETLGAPSQTLLYPYTFSKRVYNLTMWEEIQILYSKWKIDEVRAKRYPLIENMLINHFGKDLPSLKKLTKNIDLLLLNEHALWSNNRPVPLSVNFVGGIIQKPTKVLPEDLNEYLDSSKHGIIYMSFGTNIDPSMVPQSKVQAFIEVFSKLPYDVLWKWNEDELPGRTSNVRISKWFPQSDLLRHPKVKLFITQGGLQSTDEAITAGVPVIGVPMIVDQWYNVEHLVQHKVGLQLDIRTLDKDTLKNAIETVIRDSSYRENMVKLRALLHDQPESSLQRAVWWTEHVLRHGGARHLRAPAANMPWTEYYEIELVLTVAAVLTLALLLVFLIIVYLFKLSKIFLNVNHSQKLF